MKYSIRNALMAHVAAAPLMDFDGHLCMAFDGSKFDPQGCGTKGNMKIGTYATSADTISAVEVASYFNDRLVSDTMKTGDVLVVKASNATRAYAMTVSGTAVTLGGPPNQAAVVAALTENASAIAGSNDGDLPDLSGNPSAYSSALMIAVVAAARENATKINAVLTSLKNAKLMASA